MNSGNLLLKTILIQASKEEGATTRAKARRLKQAEAPNNQKWLKIWSDLQSDL